MSSPSFVAPTSQSNTAALTPLSTSASNAGSRPNMRSNSQVKSADGGTRRQSPADSGSRRPPAQKAWASGTNPLTQRGLSLPQSNGATTPSKALKSSIKEVGGLDKYAHDRSTAAFGAAMGSITSILTKTGERYEGLMSGALLDPGSIKITLKMTKKIPLPDSNVTNGAVSREATLIGASPEYAITFEMRDLIEIEFSDLSLVENAKMVNGTATKFRTDADISGNVNRGDRPLQKWEAPEGQDSSDFSLDPQSTADWDQFATARQMTGVESTYHEDEYTTPLDKSSISYRMKEAEAARLEKEILGISSTNVHLREERGQQIADDPDDEEAKYSGVHRNDQVLPALAAGPSGKYTPPAKRAPTGQPTVPGAPVDPAIVSTTKPSVSAVRMIKEDAGEDAQPYEQSPPGTEKIQSTSDEAKENVTMSVSPQRAVPLGGQTEGVEDRLLSSFREFKDTEKQKLLDRRRQQASQDRTAKLNELLRFSKTFKLKTPIPNDLVGILAKDPVKQEAIIEKAKREHEESTSIHTSPSANMSDTSARTTELPHVAQIPDRQQTFNKGRGGYPQASVRGASQQNMFSGRGNGTSQRLAGSKPLQPHQIPAAIPILDGRPPTGPLAEQTNPASPQRSSLVTPTSASSISKFNLSVKAAEFRPNAAAQSFNPSVSSNAPSSPASMQRNASVSRAASPSSFFGTRKPRAQSEREPIANAFNPIQRMRAEVMARVSGSETGKPDAGSSGPQKDYAANGGIPHAYQTGPRWIVRQENEEKTYMMLFERPMPPTPQVNRTGPIQHIQYHGQMPHNANAPTTLPQISTPQHVHTGLPHPYSHHYDDGHGRPMMPINQIYSSPSITSRQTSAYASPMVPGAQLAYSSQPYFGAGTQQIPVQMRYSGLPMHPGGQLAAPVMVPQPSNGPYMPMPQQYNPPMPMYSPNPGHAYPQPNGYGSPSRAPMMTHQGSQSGHHPGQPMVYTMSQSGPMGYPPPGQAGMARAYGQFGSTPQQPYGVQNRTMSAGYGKMMPQQQMQQTQGPMLNASQPSAAYPQQVDMIQDEGK